MVAVARFAAPIAAILAAAFAPGLGSIIARAEDIDSQRQQQKLHPACRAASLGRVILPTPREPATTARLAAPTESAARKCLGFKYPVLLTNGNEA